MQNELNVCPICSSSDLQLLFAAKCNADGVIDGYNILDCNNCTVKLTDPIPESVDTFYNSGIYTKSGGRAGRVINIVFSWLYNARLREINKLGLSGGRLLDVGCGKGRFIAHAYRRGWKAEGTDVIQDQVNTAKDRSGLKISLGEIWEIGYQENSFDVITAWHVLEHLAYPHKVIGEVARILRKGGVFVCEVPYQASWQARIGKGYWFQLDVPRHLIHYNLPSLQYLLNEHNLQIKQIHTFSPELGYFGMLQTMLNRVVSPPNWLFQWLKRTRTNQKSSAVLAQLILATVFAPPAIILESTSILLHRGGVLRVLATKQ